MKTIFISFCVLAFLFASRAQKCPEFFPDTIMVPSIGKTLSGEYLQANLKNGSMGDLLQGKTLQRQQYRQESPDHSVI